MKKEHSTYTFNIPMLRQAEDIVRRNGGESLPQAFALYAKEIVRQGQYPIIHESKTALSANDYANRLAKVNESLDAVMCTLSHHSGIAAVRAQASWDIRMCLGERRHCKHMLAKLTERKEQFPEATECRKGA